MQSASSVIEEPRKAVVEATASHRLLSWAFAPTDIASLAFFRVSIGLIFFVSAFRYFTKGWIADFLYPELHFTYYGFSWVKPWPLWGLYTHFAITALASLGVMFGLFYRVSAVIAFVGLTYVFLLEQSDYLNHFYLICLLAFLMIFIPAHRAFSLDAWRKPKWRSDYLPAWPRLLLLAQLSIVYLYAGVAKLNPEWLAAAPLRVWLADTGDIPVVGRVLATEFGYYMFAWGGLAFDLFIVPLMLWPRTRMFGYIWGLAFHFLNFLVFDIGVFPWMMMLATLLYFPADWPRRLVERWRGAKAQSLSWRPATPSWAPLVFCSLYLLLQILFPLRHLLYPGKVDWTEEGHRFAWRMMLNSKDGTIRYMVTDPVTKETWEVDARRYLTRTQYGQAATCPDMVLQMAHFLARAEAAAHNYTQPLEVRAISSVSLNGRPEQPMIDPTVNLAAEPRNLKHAKWIVPFRDVRGPMARLNSKRTNQVAGTRPGVVEPLPSERMAELQRAAEAGDATAQLKLAEAFRDGATGATNLQSAFSWFSQAAHAGLAEAQYQSALSFLNGRGVQTNLIQAMKWSMLAARQSHRQSMTLQDELRLTLTPFQMAVARRLVTEFVEQRHQVENPAAGDPP